MGAKNTTGRHGSGNNDSDLRTSLLAPERHKDESGEISPEAVVSKEESGETSCKAVVSKEESGETSCKAVVFKDESGEISHKIDFYDSEDEYDKISPEDAVSDFEDGCVEVSHQDAIPSVLYQVRQRIDKMARWATTRCEGNQDRNAHLLTEVSGSDDRSGGCGSFQLVNFFGKELSDLEFKQGDTDHNNNVLETCKQYGTNSVKTTISLAPDSVNLFFGAVKVLVGAGAAVSGFTVGRKLKFIKTSDYSQAQVFNMAMSPAVTALSTLVGQIGAKLNAGLSNELGETLTWLYTLAAITTVVNKSKFSQKTKDDINNGIMGLLRQYLQIVKKGGKVTVLPQNFNNTVDQVSLFISLPRDEMIECYFYTSPDPEVRKKGFELDRKIIDIIRPLNPDFDPTNLDKNAWPESLYLFSNAVRRLSKSFDNGQTSYSEYPHMLITGAPSTGKTFSINEILKAMGWKPLTGSPAEFLDLLTGVKKGEMGNSSEWRNNVPSLLLKLADSKQYQARQVWLIDDLFANRKGEGGEKSKADKVDEELVAELQRFMTDPEPQLMLPQSRSVYYRVKPIIVITSNYDGFKSSFVSRFSFKPVVPSLSPKAIKSILSQSLPAQVSAAKEESVKQYGKEATSAWEKICPLIIDYQIDELDCHPTGRVLLRDCKKILSDTQGNVMTRIHQSLGSGDTRSSEDEEIVIDEYLLAIMENFRELATRPQSGTYEKFERDYQKCKELGIERQAAFTKQKELIAEFEKIKYEDIYNNYKVMEINEIAEVLKNKKKFGFYYGEKDRYFVFNNETGFPEYLKIILVDKNILKKEGGIFPRSARRPNEDFFDALEKVNLAIKVHKGDSRTIDSSKYQEEPIPSLKNPEPLGYLIHKENDGSHIFLPNPSESKIIKLANNDVLSALKELNKDERKLDELKIGEIPSPDFVDALSKHREDVDSQNQIPLLQRLLECEHKSSKDVSNALEGLKFSGFNQSKVTIQTLFDMKDITNPGFFWLDLKDGFLFKEDTKLSPSGFRILPKEYCGGARVLIANKSSADKSAGDKSVEDKSVEGKSVGDKDMSEKNSSPDSGKAIMLSRLKPPSESFVEQVKKIYKEKKIGMGF